MSSAAIASSHGVTGSQACSCHRSTWSVPSRASEASRADSRWPREVPRPIGPGPVCAVRLGRDEHLVARDDVGEQPTEHALALAAGVDVGGVDERAAGLAEGDSCAAASSSSVSRPQVIVPRASRETTRPLRPR